MFEKEEVKIRRPPNTHEAPGADALNERIDRVIQATLGEWQIIINDHLDNMVKTAENKAANSPTPHQDLLVRTVSTTIEATVNRILERVGIKVTPRSEENKQTNRRGIE